MRTTMLLALPVVMVAACGEDQPKNTPVSEPSASAADASAAVAKDKVPIDLVMRWNGSSCEIVEPGRTVVKYGQTVYWRYKNKNGCKGKKTQRIDPKGAPIDGDCKKNTDVDEGKEVDGGGCWVNPTGKGGVYKYKIDGHVVLDPELDIQYPPPPPPPVGMTPTPGPQ
jgi:hypothetical protein